ncbi:MAG: hypothetical protein ABSC06_23935, partial [Rhodopila sp.]
QSNPNTAANTTAKLAVVTGTANSYGIFQVVENGSGASLLTIGAGGAVTQGIEIQSGTAAAPITFYQGASLRLQIDSSGNVDVANALTTGGVYAQASGVGSCAILTGGASYTGQVEFFNASGTRYGFVGFCNLSVDNGPIQLESENGATGYQVTGNLAVAGTTTLSGALTTTNPVVDSNANAAAPTTGNTVTIAATIQHQIINPAGTLAALTVVSPAAPSLGATSVQSLDILFTAAITALTWTAGSGTTFGGAAMPGSVAAGACVRLLWVQSLSKWLHTIEV